MEIYHYMVRRAAFEQVEHSLPKAFYRDALRRGCRSFFKVQVDDEGNVLCDDENTEFFKIWEEQKRNCRDGMIVRLDTEDIPTDDYAKQTGRSESGSAQGLKFDLVPHTRNGTWTLCLRDGDGALCRFWNDIDPTELHRLLHMMQTALLQTEP